MDKSVFSNFSDEDVEFMESYGHPFPPRRNYAKWVHDIEDHGDYPGQLMATRSPDVIRHWAEERGAVLNRNLTIKFSKEQKAPRHEIGWDEWLDTFLERDLVFIYQETKPTGELSLFHKIEKG